MIEDRDTAKGEYWALSVAQVLSALGSEENGLSGKHAKERVERFGGNELPKDTHARWIPIVVEQFKSPLLLVLVFAGLITLALKEWGDSAIILGAVIVNAALGLYQELKAENTLALLESLVRDTTRVKRAGKLLEIDAREIVPGDIIELRQGSKVPADARVLTENDLHTDESTLTGESLPVHKHTDVLPLQTELAERSNMVYGGTTVVQGFGEAVVTATGAKTEFGTIAQLVKDAEREETPLQKALSQFTLRASIMLGALTVILFAIGVTRGVPLYEMFLISVATAVSAVPEGLPIALTVILAVGVERLAKRKGVVRKLLAAETLGSTTLILTDKTGTLTEARLELVHVVPHGKAADARAREEKRLLEYAIAHSDVLVENPSHPVQEWKISGSPVEVALVRGGADRDAHHPRLKDEFKVVERIPFNSSTKFAASIVEGRGSRMIVLFGAPEIVLSMTTVSEKERKEVAADIDARAEAGERVLALAVKETTSTAQLAEHVSKKDAEFLGLITFRDKVRISAKKAIEHIARAGVRTIMVTGDHAGTAKTVAKELGFDLDKDSVLLGSEIATLDDVALKLRLQHTKVIARTTPEQKLRIARCFKSLGEVVAMTGDGVNDAPALREANIGIAVGSGTDVAKSSADLVLLDNNFETIVAAVEEGRIILQNVKKVIVYVLSNSFDELFLIGGSLLMGIALPLNAMQILWVNLFSDSFPAIALAFESHTSDIGKKPSRSDGALFDREMQFLILVIGTLTSISLLVMYFVLLKLGFAGEIVRTFIFAAFGIYSLLLIFSVRSLHASIFEYRLFSNMYLVGGAILGLTMMLAAIYWPPLQALFGTVALPAEWLIAVFVFSLASIALREIAKWLFRAGILKS